MLRVFCLCVSVCLVSYYQVITFQRAEKIKGDAKKANKKRNGRATMIILIPSLKMVKIITTVLDSMCRNALGVG